MLLYKTTYSPILCICTQKFQWGLLPGNVQRIAALQPNPDLSRGEQCLNGCHYCSPDKGAVRAMGQLKSAYLVSELKLPMELRSFMWGSALLDSYPSPCYTFCREPKNNRPWLYAILWSSLHFEGKNAEVAKCQQVRGGQGKHKDTINEKGSI